MPQNKAVFLDRDGTVSVEMGYIHDKDLPLYALNPGAAEGMKKGGDGGGGGDQGAGIGLGFAMAGNMSNKMGNANATQPRGPAESKDQIMAMLKQLGELKAAGILTEGEFDTKKKELLAKL